MSLMEMSFSGAVLVAVILAVRAAVKNRLPKITFAALWMIALLRLLVPFSISSAWSIYTFLPGADSVTEQAQRLVNVVCGNIAQEKYEGEGTVDDFPDTFLTQLTNKAGSAGESEPALDQDAAVFSGMAGAQGGAASEEEPITGQVRQRFSIWNLIWAAGFLFCMAYFTWIYIRCYREFRMSLPIENGIPGNWHSTHPLKRTLSIRQSDQISSPLSYGIWRPVILLPKSTKWGDGFQLRYVLEHEYVHIRHFDAAVKLLMVAALCVHWFNPAVWLMYIFFNRDLELYCDETVIRRFGEEEKSAYAMTLIEMEEEKSGFVFLGNSFSKNAIEERISAIMKIKKKSLWACGMAAALVSGITLLFATSCKAYGEAEKTRAVNVQEYTAAGEEKKEGQYVNLAAEAVLDESTEVYHNTEDVKKLKTELRKREKELDELIQLKETQLSLLDTIQDNLIQEGAVSSGIQVREESAASEGTTQRNGQGQSSSDFTMEDLVEEIEQLKEERISLRDMETDLEWYDFVEEHYKEYGISYHLPEKRLYSVNTPIRYFYDEKNGGVLWADNEGEVVLEVIYDKQGKILCLSGGPADSDGSVDEFFTDAAADAVHEAGQAEKGRVRVAGEVTAVVEDAAKDSVDIAYAISKSKEFSEYKKFGISYDKKTGYLMYDGKTVGYFMDETAPGVYTRFADGSGESGITVVRDSGEIVRIEAFPFGEKEISDAIVSEDIEYSNETTSEATASIEYIDEITSAAAMSEVAYKSGDETESSIPEEYSKFGMTSDEKTNSWMYQGKGVAAIYDKDNAIYTNSTIPEKNAIYIEVKRDKKGRVTELHEVTKKEMQKLLEEN